MKLQLWFVVLAAGAGVAGACGDGRAVKQAAATSGGEAYAAPEAPLLVAGNGQSCGLRSGGALYCWGKNAEQVPKGSYHRVSVGFDHGCAIRAEAPRLGELDCWGRDDLEQASPPKGKFIEVAAGYAHTCALRSNGKVLCFGRDPKGASKPPAQTRFSALSAGKGFSCGITKDEASVECWGDSGTEQTEGAIGHFVMVSSGPQHSGALSEDGTLQCWGLDKNAKGLKVPEGRFRAVAVGLEQACGLLRDGTVACFSSDPAANTTAPDGEFFALAAGWVHTCGIRQDGDVECWGSDFNGESQPHAQFTHVTVPGGSARDRGDRASDEEKPAKQAAAEKKPEAEPEPKPPAAEAKEPKPAKEDPKATAAKVGKGQTAVPAGGSDMSFDLEETEAAPAEAKPKTKAEEAREKRQKDKEKPVNLKDFLK